MSVGKASIKRAASAGTKKTAAKAVTSTVIGNPSEEVKKAILTPMNPEEIQVKFLSKKSPEEKSNRPVRLTEDMTDYLL